jgi:hypothetical protein
VSDDQWVLAAMLGCIVMLGYTVQAGLRLRAARREGLSPEDQEYGWETVLGLGLVWSAALLWFATLLE